MLSRVIILILFKSQSNDDFASELLISGAGEVECKMITSSYLRSPVQVFPMHGMKINKECTGTDTLILHIDTK